MCGRGRQDGGEANLICVVLYYDPQAVFAAYNLLKRKIKIEETIAMVKQHRAQVRLSRSLFRGLFKMYDDLKDHQRAALDRRLKHTMVLSCAF